MKQITLSTSVQDLIILAFLTLLALVLIVECVNTTRLVKSAVGRWNWEAQQNRVMTVRIAQTQQLLDQLSFSPQVANAFRQFGWQVKELAVPPKPSGDTQ